MAHLGHRLGFGRRTIQQIKTPGRNRGLFFSVEALLLLAALLAALSGFLVRLLALLAALSGLLVWLLVLLAALILIILSHIRISNFL